MSSQRTSRRVGAFAGSALLLCIGTQAAAADWMPTTPGGTASWQFPSGIDDWSSFKTYLRERGVDLQLGYTGELAANAAGGTNRSAAYADQYTVGATLDLERLAGIRDTIFQATITERTGRNLSDDVGLGTLQQVQEVFGRGQTARLTQFWIDRKFASGMVDWKRFLRRQDAG